MNQESNITRKLRVLVACEFSGRVREAFILHGHDAVSCDWAYDTEIPGPHYKGDVRDILYEGWDLMVAHPDCTYLANSGVQWLTRTPKNPSANVLYGAARWEAMQEAAEFFNLLRHAPIKSIAVENPIPHRFAVEAIGESYTQLIQPWQFGEVESKATCLWLKNLPLLIPSEVIPKEKRKQSLHKLAPSENRAHERGRTFQGIANAFAEQWG